MNSKRRVRVLLTDWFFRALYLWPIRFTLVLPANRDLVMATNRAVIPFYQLLALEPWETPYAKYPIPDAIELRDRVFDKIKTEDKEMSSILNEIQWNVEDETSMQMISPGEKPLETVSAYIR